MRLEGCTLGKDTRNNIVSSHRSAGNRRGMYALQTKCFVTNLLFKVVDKLGLSYRTANQLNAIIDNDLSGRPPFKCQKFKIGDETLEFYYRDVVECIRSLYGDPQFVQDLILAPERHYTSPERTCRIYNEMHTGDWWWTVQVCNYASMTNYCD